jgi:hypothetical protein
MELPRMGAKSFQQNSTCGGAGLAIVRTDGFLGGPPGTLLLGKKNSLNG